MPPRKKKQGSGFFKDLAIPEHVRMAVNLRLREFRGREDENEFEFPTSFGSDERCYVHRLALEMGLKSKSRGKGATRFLTVYKRDGSTIMQSDAGLKLSPAAREMAAVLLDSHPVTNKERQELLPPTDRERNPYLSSEGQSVLPQYVLQQVFKMCIKCVCLLPKDVIRAGRWES